MKQLLASLALNFLVLLLMPAMCSGQRISFPRGIYFSHESLLDGVPDRTDTLQVIRRSDGDLAWMGGNDYKFDSNNSDLKWRHIHQKVLAYVHNDSIFLNGKKMELEPAFCLGLTKGMYLAFYSVEKNGGAAAAGVLGGAIGGAIAAAASQSNGDVRGALYVLSLKTGNAKRLGTIYTTARLEENSPELLGEFKKELHPDSHETLIKYINRLNEVLDK
jgi:hypothetical protein